MPKMFGFFLFVFFVMCEKCGGMTPPEIDPRAGSVFPKLGFELCSLIVNEQAKTNCTSCFANANSDWLLASDCVDSWLPTRFASCVATSSLRIPGGNGNNGNAGGNGNNGNAGGNGNNGNPGGNGDGGSNNAEKSKFQNCLKKAKSNQMKEMNRAKVLYRKGGQYLKTVMDSTIIEDGGATIFSCMAQELLMDTKELKSPLGKCERCFSRFQMDPVNEQWHLGHGHKTKPHKKEGNSEAKQRETPIRLGERTLVYDYGYVGNDMPFHGIGPLATDILKGECIYKKLAEAGDLDALVLAILENDHPVPAWIFRELLNNISILNLP